MMRFVSNKDIDVFSLRVTRGILTADKASNLFSFRQVLDKHPHSIRSGFENLQELSEELAVKFNLLLVC